MLRVHGGYAKGLKHFATGVAWRRDAPKGKTLNGMPQLPKALMRLNKIVHIAAAIGARINLLAGEHHLQCPQQLVSHPIVSLITGLMEG